MLSNSSWAASAMTDAATRSSWKTAGLDRPLDPVDYTDTFTDAEFAGIQRGLVPKDMDDKWFIFFEDPILYLHRSWTGNLIFTVELSAVPGGARVLHAYVVRDQDTYSRASNEEAAKLLPWLVRGLLLRQDFPFPEL